MTTVLVTGGAGYIGSHACKALAAAGFTPVTYDNLSRGHSDFVKWGPFESGDVTDGVRLNEVIETYRPAAAMHFAALAYVGESVEKPLLYYRNNVVGTQTLLAALTEAGIRNLVVSSTCAVYGTPETMPVTELMPVSPESPYGHSKVMMERMIADTEPVGGPACVALRYFNAAGADPDGEIGERHDPETHLIPNTLAAAAGRGGEMTIFGDDYDTPDGTCVRDFIHVSDIADAHVRALQHLLNGGGSSTLNLGNGQGYSVKDVISAVETVTGKAVPYAIGARRPGDPPRVTANAMRAADVLGWQPKYGKLEDQISHAWAWHQKDWS